jgi:hypothetical protein
MLEKNDDPCLLALLLILSSSILIFANAGSGRWRSPARSGPDGRQDPFAAILLPISDGLDSFLIRKHNSVAALESDLSVLKATSCVRAEWVRWVKWVSERITLRRQEKRE